MSNIDFTDPALVPGTASLPAAPEAATPPPPKEEAPAVASPPPAEPTLGQDKLQPTTNLAGNSFQQEVIQLHQAGFTDTELASHIENRRLALSRGGFNSAEIDKYMGFSTDQGALLDADIKQQVQDRLAASAQAPEANPVAVFWDTLTNFSAFGILGNAAIGKPPTRIMPAQAGLAQELAQATGLLLGGQLEAGIIGGALGVEGGPAGIAGGAIGGMTLEASLRASAAIAVTEGNVKSPQELAVRTVAAIWQGVKETAPTAAAMAAGPEVAALTAGAPAIIAAGSQIAAELAAMTGAAWAITGQVPSFNDFAAGAIMLGGGHLATSFATPAKGAAPARDIPSGYTPEASALSDKVHALVDHFDLTAEMPQDVANRVQRTTSWTGLLDRAKSLGIFKPPDTWAAIEEAWTTGDLLDQSPTLRARWFNSAIHDGVDAANTLLERSLPAPTPDLTYRPNFAAGLKALQDSLPPEAAIDPADRFNELRGASLQEDFAQNPGKYGGDLDQHLQQFDSKPPPAPEDVAAAVAAQRTPIAEQLPKLPKPKEDILSIEDAHYGLGTKEEALDIQLRKIIDQMPSRLSRPPADGSAKTLDEKFEAHLKNPEGVPLDPEELALYNQWVAPLAALEAEARAAVSGRLKPGEKAKDGSVPEPSIPSMPFVTKRTLTSLQAITHSSAVTRLVTNIAAYHRIISLAEVTDAVKESQAFKDRSVEESALPEGVAAPKGYIKIDSPSYKGLLVDPNIATPINDYLHGGPRVFQKDVPVLSTVNKIGIGALFSTPLGLLAHMKNLMQMSFVGRGWDNLNVVRGWRTGLQAMEEVVKLGPEYIGVLRKSGALQSSRVGSDGLAVFTMRRMGQAIAQDPARWGAFAKSLKLNSTLDLGRAIMIGMNKEMYRFGDILYMQRYLELKEKGMTTEQAIKATEAYIPNYRIRATTGGSRLVSRVLGDTNITAFGRFEVSKFTALGNMVTSLIGKNVTSQERFEAVGRFAAMALLLFAVKPLLDGFAQSLTGNPKAAMSLGGTANVVQAGLDFAQSPSAGNFYKAAAKGFQMAPGTQEILSQWLGKDTFTDAPISAGGPVQQVAERAVHAEHSLLSPVYGFATDWQKYVKSSIGISDPSLGSQYYAAHAGMVRVGRTWVDAGRVQARKDPGWMRGLPGG